MPAQHLSSPATAPDGLPTPRRYIAMLAALTAIVLVVLDAAIANVALPTIADTFHVHADAVWVVTGYQTALVMALLPCAALGESYGYRRVFTAGVVIFTAASLLCANAPTLPWLVAARFLQGLGGAALMSLSAAMLRFIYPKRLLGTAISWNALVVALSSAAGPSIGAGILSVASWPWLFAVNLPVGLIVLAASRALPTPPGTGRSLDGLSVVLNAIVFGTFVIGADQAATAPWIGGGLIVLAAAALTLLIWRERSKPAPLLPLDLFKRHAMRIAVSASVCCFAAQMAATIALPFYYQHGLGFSPLVTGLLMTAWPLAVASAAPLSGRLADRFPTAWLCVGGGSGLAVGLALASLWPTEIALAPLVAFTAIAGFGFGLFQTPNNRAMLLSAPRERAGAAGGVQATARLFGQTMGSVVMMILFNLIAAGLAPRFGLAVAAVLALASGLISLLRSPAVAGGDD